MLPHMHQYLIHKQTPVHTLSQIYEFNFISLSSYNIIQNAIHNIQKSYFNNIKKQHLNTKLSKSNISTNLNGM